MLVVAVMMTMMTSVLASSPQKTHNNPSNNSTGHGAPHQDKAFPVLDFDYGRVHYPFVIFLWILLASLMKLGKVCLFIDLFWLDRCWEFIHTHTHTHFQLFGQGYGEGLVDVRQEFMLHIIHTHTRISTHTFTYKNNPCELRKRTWGEQEKL